MPTVDGYTLIPNQTPYFPANDGTPTIVYYVAHQELATVNFVD
ncbi:hypothetical protein [Secundilactobacillus odoratitofui]|nr:hypothetical protein [Secundilactobacillus odoratitofui]